MAEINFYKGESINLPSERNENDFYTTTDNGKIYFGKHVWHSDLTLEHKLVEDVDSIALCGTSGDVISSIDASAFIPKVSDEYEETEYPEPFEDKASHVGEGDSMDEAFKKVETTVSALTQELLKDEKATENAVESLGDASGVILEDGKIQYVPKENAKYIGNTKSIKEAVDVLDGVIGIAEISEDYEQTVYPEPFEDKAAHVEVGDSMDTAFKSVETTVSALTQDVLDNEMVIENSIEELAETTGILLEDGKIGYTPDPNSRVISSAKTIKEALALLDGAVFKIDEAKNAVSNVRIMNDGNGFYLQLFTNDF